MTEYEVVRYRPQLRRQVAALQRHLWRGDEATNAAYLEWKYERNPYLPAPLIYLALDGDRVVGMRGMYGSCWEIGPRGERFLIPCADDFVIAPEHRNRGLFGRIMTAAFTDLAAEGHRCAFSLSPGPVTLAGSLVSGWRSLGPVHEVRRKTRDPAAPFRRLGARMHALPLLWRWANVISEQGWRLRRHAFRRLDRTAPPTPASGSVWLERAPRVEAMAELIARIGHDGRARQVRDAQYLEWRFANPLHEYRFLFAGGDRLEGYLVLQVYRLDPHRGANVVDWEAATLAIRGELLRRALEWGGFIELSAWTVTLPETTRGLLAKASFAPAPGGRLTREGTSLLVRAFDRRGPAADPVLGGRRLLDVSNWDMRMLYSMAG